MKMSLSLRTIQICAICDQEIHEHLECCELGILERLLNNQVKHNCPQKNCRGLVEINKDDYWECHDCHTQFSRTILTPNGDQLKRTVLLTENEALPVLILKDRGRGIFPYQQRIDQANELLKQKRQQLGLEDTTSKE